MVLKENKTCGKITSPDEIITEIDSESYNSPKRKLAREKARERGFEDEYHFAGWSWFNSVSNSQYNGFDVDVLHMTSSGEGFEN